MFCCVQRVSHCQQVGSPLYINRLLTLLPRTCRRLDNYPYLVRKYCGRRLQQDVTPTLNQIKEAAPLTVRAHTRLSLSSRDSIADSRVSHCLIAIQAAEVVCELYLTLGTSFLPKLKGDFAFVCFDSHKVG